MNKKLLICGAIATVLLVSACVKKEAPKEDEQEVETTQAATSEPAQFENLPSAEQNNTQQAEAPSQVEIERTQTENTTTEIRRETHEAHATTQNQATETKPAEESKPAKAESVKVETSQAAPKATAGTAQSEDDAVAAAIAAATPALKN
ncbi:MAG: internalin [Acinetobacter sp.]